MTGITETDELDRLATYRQQVSEDGEKRGKMSDTALAKLRAIKDSERLETTEGERFKNALRSVVVNPGNLRTLIERCKTTPLLKDCGWMDGAYKHHKFVEILPVERQIDRMVVKFTYWIEAGYLLGREIDTVGLVNFFSSLTVGEVKMSDSQFSGAWNDKYARKQRKHVWVVVSSQDLVKNLFTVRANQLGSVCGLRRGNQLQPRVQGTIAAPPMLPATKLGKKGVLRHRLQPELSNEAPETRMDIG
jgi:hypothetical protein